MKWIPHDIELYLKAKEYIDTAVIPLIPVSFGEEMKQAASMSEFITLITTLLERQFTGRILLLPPFTYLKNSSHGKSLSELELWVSTLKNNHLNHIFLLTCDSEWKMHEEQLHDHLIWIEAISFDNLENSQKISIINSQVKQIQAIFTQKWLKNE